MSAFDPKRTLSDRTQPTPFTLISSLRAFISRLKPSFLLKHVYMLILRNERIRAINEALATPIAEEFVPYRGGYVRCPVITLGLNIP